ARMALLRIAAPARARRGVHASARISCVMCGFLLLGGPEASAQTAAPPAEYQIKAVFLFNFAQFTEWPPAAFADGNSPLIIGILGADPFGAYRYEIVRNEKVSKRPLGLQRYHRDDEIRSCHILFISSSETATYEQVFA